MLVKMRHLCNGKCKKQSRICYRESDQYFSSIFKTEVLHVNYEFLESPEYFIDSSLNLKHYCSETLHKALMHWPDQNEL